MNLLGKTRKNLHGKSAIKHLGHNWAKLRLVANFVVCEVCELVSSKRDWVMQGYSLVVPQEKARNDTVIDVS